MHTIYLLKKVRKFHWFYTKSISAIYLKGLSPTKDAVTHSTVAFPDPVVHHTWVSVYRGSSGYTRIAIAQGKTNVTQMWRESETQLLVSCLISLVLMLSCRRLSAYLFHSILDVKEISKVGVACSDTTENCCLKHRRPKLQLQDDHLAK